MKIPTFFRFLNKKIEKYDRLATNPFITPKPVILIWIEDNSTPTNPNPSVTDTAKADLE